MWELQTDMKIANWYDNCKVSYLTFNGNNTAGIKNDIGGNENVIWDRMFKLDHGMDVSRNPHWNKISRNTSQLNF